MTAAGTAARPTAITRRPKTTAASEPALTPGPHDTTWPQNTDLPAAANGAASASTSTQCLRNGLPRASSAASLTVTASPPSGRAVQSSAPSPASRTDRTRPVLLDLSISSRRGSLADAPRPNSASIVRATFAASSTRGTRDGRPITGRAPGQLYRAPRGGRRVDGKEETRRIQKTGNSTYIVSLPKPWATDMGLKEKDEVRVVRHGSSELRVYPARARAGLARRADAAVEIGAGEGAAATVRKIISLYFLGYKTIRVRPGSGRLSAGQRSSMRKAARRMLMGAEVTSDSASGVTIQILVGLEKLTVDSAFKRMLHLAKSMLGDAVGALAGGDEARAREVVAADDEVDRFGFYIIRQLKTAIENEHVLAELGFEHARNCLGYRLIAKNIERTGDHAVRIAQDVIDVRRPIGSGAARRLSEMADFAAGALDDACLALFKKDYALAEATIRKAAGIAARESAVLGIAAGRGGGGDEVYRIRRASEEVRRIAEYASDIAEIVLNMTVERSLKKR